MTHKSVPPLLGGKLFKNAFEESYLIYIFILKNFLTHKKRINTSVTYHNNHVNINKPMKDIITRIEAVIFFLEICDF